MRIGYLCNLYPAVSHSFIRREIEGMEQAGHQVDRFTLRPIPGDLRDEADLQEAALTESVLGQGAARLIGSWLILLISSPARSLLALAVAWRLSGSGVRQKVRHFAYLLEAAWLTRRLRKLGAEHLHAHFGTNPAAIAMLSAKLGGPPFSFTVHGPDEFDAPVALSLPAKIDAASFVVAISSYGRSQLMRWSRPEYWHKIEVVRCGLDSAFLEGRPMPVSASSVEFVCVARLSAQKGLPLLIAVCDRLRRDGEKFSLTIIGDGEMRTELESEVRKRGLQDVVTMAGIQSSSEIREHLSRARAFVLPSFAEGLPVVLMESLALATPVITTSIAGIPELVNDQCGWVVPAGSEDALVDAMKAALRATHDQIVSMGKIGRKRVQLMHDARRNAAELAGLVAGIPT